MKCSLVVCVVAVSFLVLTCSASHAVEERAVFGARTFTKDSGGFQEYSEGFVICNPANCYAVIVENGDASGNNKVTRGSVFINGSPVIYQADFVKGFSRIERVKFNVGEQNSIYVRLNGGEPGSFLTVTVAGYRMCIKPHIDGPGDGGLVEGSNAVVYGTIDMPEGTEAGVTVNGMPAEVNGSAFALSGLPLSPGLNNIVAFVTDDLGNFARDIVTVTASEPSPSYVRLTPYPVSGTAPLEVSFSVDESIPAAGTLYELDFDGDGLADVSAPDLDTLAGLASHTYDAEEIYYPSLAVTDADGGSYFTTAVVNVYAPPDLAGKWGDMKTALAAGRITEAAGYIAESTREGYREVFQAFATEGVLADAAEGMGDIQITNHFGNYAEGDMRVMQDGVEYSFYVLFEKGADGVWRIKSF